MKRLLFRIIGILLFFLFALSFAYPWGNSGHKLINRRAAVHLPSSMNFFKAESLFFELHSTDADSRVNYSDTSFYAEWPSHYFNIDDYPDWTSLTHNLDSLIKRYSRNWVKQDGLNPWRTKLKVDSLTAQFARRDYNKAKLTASDLGHYVAEAYEPLNCTINSDGQFTGNHGIHDRYEFLMIDTFRTSIEIHPVAVRYISSPVDFAFDYIYQSYALINQILMADNYAKLASGWDGTGIPPTSYYDTLWSLTKGFTKNQFQNASSAIASLWYTAWVNGGMNSTPDDLNAWQPNSFNLDQNYPNPFNSTTVISYTLPDYQYVTLEVFDILGRQLQIILCGYQTQGKHSVNVNAADLPSGAYFYKLSSGVANITKKLILMK